MHADFRQSYCQLRHAFVRDLVRATVSYDSYDS
jgi:hypothetical protein